MSLPRSLSDSLGLSAAEEESILKDMAILARVKSAEARGTVIMEISRELFESMTAQLALQQGVTFEVRWTFDEMGFAAPTVYRHEKKVDETV